MVPKSIQNFVFGLSMAAFIGNANAALIHSDADLGAHALDAVTINLGALADHTEIQISYDLYILDSWDGSDGGYSPDFFVMSVDGDATATTWTFDNFGGTETNTDIADAVGNFNSQNTWGEIDRLFINYNEGFTFSHTDDELTLAFQAAGAGFQPFNNDETWRITNLQISSNAVPEPGSFMLLATGLITLIPVFLKRKRK